MDIEMRIGKAARRIHEEWLWHAIPVPSAEYLARIIREELGASKDDSNLAEMHLGLSDERIKIL